MNDLAGTSTSLELPKQFHCGVTANGTRLVPSSLEVTVESEQPATTEAHQAWRDVAHALGELQMWLLAPATQTALPFTPS